MDALVTLGCNGSQWSQRCPRRELCCGAVLRGGARRTALQKSKPTNPLAVPFREALSTNKLLGELELCVFFWCGVYPTGAPSSMTIKF